jgi:hypothetical protein
MIRSMVKSRNLILAILTILVWVALCTGNFAVSQENYYLETFTRKDGLPNNTIRSIAQDRTGFLWIATWDGLSRFDGYEFKNYYHNPNDSTSLPSFILHKIVVDKQNNLWVLTSEQQVVMYDRRKDNFKQSQIEYGFSPTNMTLDNKGTLWIVGKKGLLRFDYAKGKFSQLNMMDIRSELLSLQNAIPSITSDNSGNLFIFREENGSCQIYKSKIIEESRAIFYKMIPFNILAHYPQRIFNRTNSYRVIETNQDTDWLFSNFGFLGRIGKDGRIEEHKGKLPKGEFKGIPSFSWNNMDTGIPFYNSDSNSFGSVSKKIDEQPNTSFFDNKNTLWYSTIDQTGEGTGLTHALEVPTQFKHYFLDQNKNSVPNAIYAVMKTKNGEIWAAPRNLNHLFRLKTNRELVQCNKLDEKTWNLVKHPRAFYEDSTGIIIGYYRNMLTRFDPIKNKFSVVKFNKSDSILSGVPYSFRGFEQNGKNLIINGDKAIYAYSFSKDQMTEVWSGKTLNTPVYCLKKDTIGNYWIGLRNSTIKRLDHDFNEIGTYKLSKGSYNVEDLIFGDNSDIWATLLGGGLAHLDLKRGKTENLTTTDGLSNNTANSLLKDKSGSLWISTDQGLSRYNPKTRQFRIFGPQDGLKIEVFNTDAAYQSTDGEMLFGGMGGVVVIYPESMKEAAISPVPAPLLITDFKVSGLPRYFSKAIYDLDTISLQKGENNFQLSFASIDFVNGNKLKYRYRLNPIDLDFIGTDYRHRFASYVNLTPGEYYFTVEATNEEGEWITKTSILIRVPSFYYQTFWFKLLLLVSIISLLGIFILMYNRQIRLKASRKQAELRLESLRGQMNPHFIFNSLNSINYFISQNDRLSANRYIADFSHLIRSFLGNLSKEYIPFESELETIKDYLQLEHLRFGDKFDYQLIVPDDFDLGNKMVFPGMVQPFIENAIWHGVRGLTNRKGTITIRFLPGSEEHCLCVIEDDGIGRKLSVERKNAIPGKKSNGIVIVTERLKIINQIRQKNLQLIMEDLYPDREETGTRVTIEIPLRKDDRKL